MRPWDPHGALRPSMYARWRSATSSRREDLAVELPPQLFLLFFSLLLNCYFNENVDKLLINSAHFPVPDQTGLWGAAVPQHGRHHCYQAPTWPLLPLPSPNMASITATEPQHGRHRRYRAPTWPPSPLPSPNMAYITASKLQHGHHCCYRGRTGPLLPPQSGMFHTELL